MRPPGKLWIVIARPDRLPAALLAVQTLRESFAGGCHLLREHSGWWERAHAENFSERFDSIRDFPRVESCRGIVDLSRFHRQIAARRRRMAQLEIDPASDLLLVLSGTLAIANAAASAHPRVRKILALPQNTYENLIRPIDRTRFRFTTSGWFQNRLVEPLAGVNRTVYLKPRRNPGGDGVRLNRLRKLPSKIYHAIIVSRNHAGDFPAEADSRVILARHPTILELRDLPAPETPNERPRVVFFGTPFLLVRNLEPAIYIECLDRCLEFLRQHYAASCRLLYRPHPAETTEAARLNLSGFEIESDRDVAELFFLRYFRSISAVFSVSSTVSRVALNNGINAYCFWPCFPFPRTTAKFFETVMGEVPPEFELRNLSRLPIPYQGKIEAQSDAVSFVEALRAAVAKVQGM